MILKFFYLLYNLQNIFMHNDHKIEQQSTLFSLLVSNTQLLLSQNVEKNEYIY